MHIHFVYDVDWWALGLFADGLGKAIREHGYKFTSGNTAFAPDIPDAWMVGFADLLDAPGMEDVPLNKTYVGLFSHWELRTDRFRENLPRLREAKGIYAGCAQIAASAANAIGRKVFCLPGGIDTTTYKPGLGASPVFRAGWSGNAELECKRYDMAVGACRLAEVEFVPIGRGRGLTKKALEEMPAYMQDLSVYLCTSKEDCGPTGPLEAGACGVPTISTMCGFMPEFISHGETGWICHTVEQFADQLKQLKKSHYDCGPVNSEAGRVGALAWMHTTRHWSWKARSKGYLAMFEGRSLTDDVFEPDPERPPEVTTTEEESRPLACVALMRCMDVEDAAVESSLWRLVKGTEKSPGLFTWTLAPSPPLASVDWARSKLLTECLRMTEAAVFVVQDGDMGVDLLDYEHLANQALKRDAICGSMLCKRGGGGMCGIVDLVKHFGDPETNAVQMYSDQQAQLEDDEYNGAALTAYPRTVLERLTKVLPWVIPHGTPPDNAELVERDGFWPFFMPELRPYELAWTPESHRGCGIYMTEDRAFCDIARGLESPLLPTTYDRQGDHKEEIWISLKPQVAHWGSFAWYPHMAYGGKK